MLEEAVETANLEGKSDSNSGGSAEKIFDN